MITPNQVRTALYDLLKRELPGVVSVYTGVVPQQVPTYADGSIRPYIGLWVSNSVGDQTMRGLDSLSPMDAVRVYIQTQIVAATEGDVYETADLITPLLTNAPIGEGWVLPDAEQHATAMPLLDTTTTPHIPYLPLLWQLETQ